MTIGTNAVGNYAPKIQKTNTTVKTQEPQVQETKNEDMINRKEKKFFAGMYPENKTEIMNYHFYQKSGSMSGVSKGSLLDRRG